MSAQRYAPDASVVVVCGHYGVEKTNFSLNLAFDARERGVDVTLVDLDVVNPTSARATTARCWKNGGFP